MNGKWKNQLRLNWDPSFTQIIEENKKAGRESERERETWPCLQYQRVLTAQSQERTCSWNLGHQVSKCRLHLWATDIIQCTVYTPPDTRSTTARTARLRPSPDLCLIHTSTRSVAIPPVRTSAPCRLTQTTRLWRRPDWRTQVRNAACVSLVFSGRCICRHTERMLDWSSPDVLLLGLVIIYCVML